MESNNTNGPAANNKIVGTRSQSRKKLLIFGIAAIAIALFCIFGLGLFSKPKVVQVMKAYGKMNHEVTYDKNNITEEEVDYLANGLTKANFFDEAATKYVYIKKIHKTVELSISANPLITGNPPAMQAFDDLRKNMQKQFPNNKIVINLVVYNFNNVLKRLE
jgi:ABC-type antimicrobial peptide transport system permease subunit